MNKVTRKQVHNAPIFIDTPGPYASLREWREFRRELDTIDHPDAEPLKREADRAIAEARRQLTALRSR